MKASTEGPQTIRNHHVAVVVISEETYLSLTAGRPSFREFLINCPWLEGVDVTRDKSPMRHFDL